MSSDLSFEIEGLSELTGALEAVAKKYPDKAGELLVQQAKELRKDVVKQVKNDTETDGSSKRSLAKTGSYEISQVKGFGEQQYVEVSAKSPHFHLLENGHMKVVPRTRTVTRPNGEKVKITNPNGGQVIGFVPGYHFMDAATRKRRLHIPEELESTVAKLLKDEGLA